MDALRRNHAALRSGGTLLDIHPEPAPRRIQVRLDADAPFQDVGIVPRSEDAREDIRNARAALDAQIAAGHFNLERAIELEIDQLLDAPDDWQEWLVNAKVGRLDVDEAMMAAAMDALDDGGAIRIRQQVRAWRLRKGGR